MFEDNIFYQYLKENITDTKYLNIKKHCSKSPEKGITFPFLEKE